MNDNFDSNVAKRKPSTKKNRPAHPWDVNDSRSVLAVPLENKTFLSTDLEDKGLDSSSSNTKKLSKKPESIKSDKKTTRIVFEQKQNDLSNSININSNYCKLHNDVSDHLLKLLSPSAQAVYLRLYRQSFGWNRNWAAESLPKLISACNISLQTVRKAIKELESIGCIKKEFSDYHKATVYRVYLPSEIDSPIYNNSIYGAINNRGLIVDTQNLNDVRLTGQYSHPAIFENQISDTNKYNDVALKNFEDDNVFSGGQKINIQSIYSLGTNIYDLLKSSGPLPKNIYIYMNNKHLFQAVKIIDEFYDSCGFSIVSKSQYRKSLFDYFEMIKSGFSSEDIRYAVRWTFKNSRSRPESFSLIKHTLHLAMDDFIRELKNVSGEKDMVKEKQEALKRKNEQENKESIGNISEKDMKMWLSVVDDLNENINKHSFSAFIKPLKLVEADEKKIIVSSPSDSLTWVIDHFVEKIEKSYLDKTGKVINVEVR